MKKIFILFIILSVVKNSNAQNVGIGTTTPQAKLSVGTNSPFQVDSVGNIKKINNVPYNFPTTQSGNGKTLINTGSGNLDWGYAVPPKAIILADYTDTTFLKTQGFSVLKSVNGTAYGIDSTINSSSPNRWLSYDSADLNALAIPLLEYGTMIDNGVDDQLLYIFGEDSLIWGYNYNTKSWGPFVAKAPISTRIASSFCAVNSVFYVWGGQNITNNIQNIASKKDGAKYNLFTGLWSPIANAPDSLTSSKAVYMSTDGYIYFIGGSRKPLGGSGSFIFDNIYKYNVTTNTWTGPLNPINGHLANIGECYSYNGNILTVGKSILAKYNIALNRFDTLATYSTGTANNVVPNILPSFQTTYNEVDGYFYIYRTIDDPYDGESLIDVHYRLQSTPPYALTQITASCNIKSIISEYKYRPWGEELIKFERNEQNYNVYKIMQYDITGSTNCQRTIQIGKSWYYMKKN